jgi:glycine/D-amino acid oxidase-like deaminating enzyme
MSDGFDVAVVGAGVMGSTAALFLARGGMKVVLIDRGGICRGLRRQRRDAAA